MKLLDKIFKKDTNSQLDVKWHSDGIYLQDPDKQVKAVCSNDKIAMFLAECVNDRFNKSAENASIATINAEKAAEAAQAAVEMAKRAKMEAELATRTINVISVAPPVKAVEPDIVKEVEPAKYNSEIGPNSEIRKIESLEKKSVEKQKSDDQQYRSDCFKKFVEDSYYLYVAISKAQIPVTTIGLAFVEKSFHKFCKSMFKFFKNENIVINDSDGNILKMDIPDEVNNK